MWVFQRYHHQGQQLNFCIRYGCLFKTVIRKKNDAQVLLDITLICIIEFFEGLDEICDVSFLERDDNLIIT